MEKDSNLPAVFTPENEPYLGLKSLMWFDRIIVWALTGNRLVAEYTHSHKAILTRLQLASCQIIPQGINIALAMRELVRQGYLLPGLVLMRPLIERAAIISYLDMHPDACDIWENGWTHKDRPSLATMLHEMNGASGVDEAQRIVSAHNHIVHGDPIASYYNLINLPDGSVGYASGKILDNPDFCDNIAMEAQCYLIVLASRMSRIFSEVDIPAMESQIE